MTKKSKSKSGKSDLQSKNKPLTLSQRILKGIQSPIYSDTKLQKALEEAKISQKEQKKLKKGLKKQKTAKKKTEYLNKTLRSDKIPSSRITALVNRLYPPKIELNEFTEKEEAKFLQNFENMEVFTTRSGGQLLDKSYNFNIVSEIGLNKTINSMQKIYHQLQKITDTSQFIFFINCKMNLESDTQSKFAKEVTFNDKARLDEYNLFKQAIDKFNNYALKMLQFKRKKGNIRDIHKREMNSDGLSSWESAKLLQIIVNFRIIKWIKNEKNFMSKRIDRSRPDDNAI